MLLFFGLNCITLNLDGVFMNNKSKVITFSIAGVIVVLVVTLVIVVFCLSGTNREYVFIEDDIYFGMSESTLTSIKGNPAKVNSNISDTSMDEYVYTEFLNDYRTELSYIMYDSRLMEVCATIRDIDYNSALAISESIINKQESYYSGDSGYYSSEMKADGNAGFSISNGVNRGATGISFDYQYSADTLIINAIRQE